ncbi:PAS domain-containing protein [Confluentibacter lentus]|uniref:PAS domain-containing protein n=1 Tax=Confluentibacter lentus TaxID=1699412 RepID=UPI000C294744|nr:PAS domain S-box protein [Confluentibacter lentus]
MKLINQQIWRDNPENILLDFLKSQTSISIMDILGRIIYVNAQFCKLVESSNEQLVGEVNLLLKSERHVNPLYKGLWATIKRGQIWKGILSSFTSSGKMFWMEATIIPVRNSKGMIDKYVAFYLDVTQETEKNLKLVNRGIEFKTFKGNIPEVILSINEFGDILNISQGIDGFSIVEIVGSSLYNFINPIFHEKVKNVVKNVFNNAKPNRYETMDFNKEGVQTFFISQIVPVLNSKGLVISARISVQEVKNIRDVKQKLIENESRYHNLFQSMKVGIIVVVDDEGKITEWNKGAELAFGYAESEIIGEYLTKLIANKSRKSSLIELLSAVGNLEDFSTSDTVEMKALNKNGLEFPVEFALSKWKTRNSTFYCAMMLDITKRKNLENRLISKTKELELFLYRSAHDLKAPISSAEGLVNLIKQEKINDSVLNLTSMLDASLNRGKVVVENLSLASMVCEKSREISRIDFNKIINNVLKSLNGLENFKSIDFKIDIPDSIEYYSSVDLMNSLFQNLIQNAIKYSISKKSQVRSIIEIKINNIQDGIVFTVKDNGIGIIKKNLSKIFDLYYRENIEDTPGSGLGLYIVKNIVENLNGEIKVTSKVNEGSCFKIKLQNFIYIKTA